MSILFIISDGFFITKNIYQLLQTIIKLLIIARSDIYFSEYTMTQENKTIENRNPVRHTYIQFAHIPFEYA